MKVDPRRAHCLGSPLSVSAEAGHAPARASQPLRPEADTRQEAVCGQQSPTGQRWQRALPQTPEREPTQVPIGSRTSESRNDGRFTEWEIPQQ